MDDCEGGEKETIREKGRGDCTRDKMDDCERGEKETREEKKEEMARETRWMIVKE